ncbi:hypothetical protein [Acinetobacter kyonggiensis]|uniref:Uncharacterized protein n=1 Tax=Acinetobacter kyonggiensis TaxID=595670 RepID=A0A1H3MEW0_9GAMM|nr:hypothetical protein [Acinetobacter kyonggiensis]SDY75200.1 hypothetical protein SAMN05421643_12627 [Acinetobacter kyonggiensis]
MKNIIIAIGILMIFWQVIYPKYQSYKYEKVAREYLKTTWADDTKKEISSKQPQGLHVELLNQYPNIRIYQNFLVDIVAIPELLNKDTFQQAWCGQLNGLTAMEVKPRLAMLKVFEQDKVTFYLIVKDKFGKEIFSFQQRISECPNFDKLRVAKQGEVIAETKEETFVPSAAPAVMSSPSESAASVQ